MIVSQTSQSPDVTTVSQSDADAALFSGAVRDLPGSGPSAAASKSESLFALADAACQEELLGVRDAMAGVDQWLARENNESFGTLTERRNSLNDALRDLEDALETLETCRDTTEMTPERKEQLDEAVRQGKSVSDTGSALHGGMWPDSEFPNELHTEVNDMPTHLRNLGNAVQTFFEGLGNSGLPVIPVPNPGRIFGPEA